MCYNGDICAMKQAHIVKLENQNKVLKEQLIEAKELLLELYYCIPSSIADGYRETFQKVALFFKDSEVSE